jgi:hypothetical protein
VFANSQSGSFGLSAVAEVWVSGRGSAAPNTRRGADQRMRSARADLTAELACKAPSTAIDPIVAQASSGVTSFAMLANPNTRISSICPAASTASRSSRLKYLRPSSTFAIRLHDLATYVEELQNEVSAPSVKQQFTAVGMLFDWRVIGQIVPTNPAAAVRGPKHVVKMGNTTVLERAEWHRVLDSIPSHDAARSARPRVDCHPHLQLCAHYCRGEDEGESRRPRAARRRRGGSAV